MPSTGPDRRPGLAARIAVMAVALLGAALLTEVGARVVDGQPLTRLRLPPPPHTAPTRDERARADLGYAAQVPRAGGVDASWYAFDPPARTSTPEPTPGMTERYLRYGSQDPYGAFMVWNRAYLRSQLCAGRTDGALGEADSFYVFQGEAGSPYPVYRHLPHLNVPGWFIPNNVGWRGPDVELNKPARTVRIALLGASTTVDPYALPFAHSELLEHWLNLWAAGQPHPFRVEVLNTARTGIDSRSIAAIVESELLPFEPDLTLYYEGANSFQPAQLLRRSSVVPRGPRRNIGTRWNIERYSAVSSRLRMLVDTWSGNGGREPGKARYEMVWPAGVNPADPDATSTALPLGLGTVVADLERMRTGIEATGGQLGVASFVWMVRDGLELSLPRDLTLFNYLNVGYSPLTYAQLRSAADFQNAVFRNYARLHRLPWFDLASQAPLDPLLFVDAVHMTDRGLRLQAWVTLQALVPWLDREVAEGRLPRPMQHPRAAHPALPASYGLESKDALRATCTQ